jgi:uncharacterized protein (TIGR02996 family)
MTTEDDFRRALAAHPDDWQTLAVYSDWLRERDDERADGYQALAALRLHPIPDSAVGWILGRDDNDQYNQKPQAVPGLLPPDWYQFLAASSELKVHGAWWCSGELLALFDAAARAFAKLPPERRAVLLAGRAQGTE